MLLGTPAIRASGRAVSVDTRKAIALLAYLALTATSVTRDRLCGVLWPESNQARARGALRRTLTSLRRAVGSDAVASDREFVALVPEALWIDEPRFEDLARREDREGLLEAAALYRGDFLAGFSVRGSPEFDDWQRMEAERLRREADRVLERLADLEMGRGAAHDAIQHAERRLELDSLNEPAYRQLLLAEARAGRRDRAIARYREAVRVLEDELGVAPLPETTDLYEQIRRGEIPADVPSRPESRPRPVPSPPSARPALVGRDDEIDRILAVHGASGQRGNLLVLSGPPGVGLSSLAEEVKARAEATGSVTGLARCHDGESGLPYAPLATLVGGLVDRAGRVLDEPFMEAVSLLIPTIGRRGEGSYPPESDGRIRFFEALRSAVAALTAGEEPGLLVVDDVQHADHATAEFLSYVVRRLPEMRLTVVLTHRAAPARRFEPLTEISAPAARSGALVKIAVGPLTDEELERLIRSGGRSGLDDAAVAEIGARSNGLPFYAVEYARAAAGGEAIAMPDRIRGVIEARFASVTPAARQVLAAGAVIGRAFPADLVKAVSGRTDEEAADALDELETLAILRRVGDEGSLYDFSHVASRQVAYSEIGAGRLRLLHRRAANALSALRQRTAADLKEAAGHAEASGDPTRAAALYAGAGDAARAVHANENAEECYLAALALGHPDVSALREACGDLATLRGDYRAAVAEYEAAAALAEGEHLGRIEHRLGSVYARRGDWKTAGSYLEAALAQSSDSARVLVLADLAVTRFRTGAQDPAAAAAREALDLAEHSGRAADFAVAANISGLLARNAGDLREAAHFLSRSREAATAAGDGPMLSAALNNLALVDGDLGRWDGAIDCLEAALAECRRIGDRHREAAVWSNLGDARFAAGLRDEAVDAVTQSARIMAEIGREGEEFLPEVWKLTEW